MYGGSTESEDELLARRLQAEEERSMSNPLAGISQLSAQEREDMMLARQMQEMDSFGRGGNVGAIQNPASTYSHNNSGGSRDDRLAYARRLQEQAFQQVHAASKPAKTTEESDLELAMKMQIEEGGGDPSTMNQEDEDLKLARFMEESGVSIRELDEEGLAAAKEGSASSLTGSLGSTLNKKAGVSSASSLGLGASAASSGASGGLLGGLYGSRRDDDSDEDDSLEFEFDGSDRKMPAGVPSSIPQPNRPKPAPSSIPSSIPTAASIPSSIPAVAAIPSTAHKPPVPTTISTGPSAIPPVMPPSSIPSGIPSASLPSALPNPAGNRKPPPSGSPQVAAIALPGGRQASIRLGSNQNRGDFQRQVPKATKSSGAGTSGGRSGLSRILPSPSKSFGIPRTNSNLSNSARRNTPSHSQSAHNLLSMRAAARNASRPERSVSPPRRQRGKKANRTPEASTDPMLGDLPPGVNMASANDPLALTQGSGEPSASTPVKKKKGKIFSRIFGGGKQSNEAKNVQLSEIPDAIPAAIPGPPGGGAAGPLPHSVSVSRNINQNSLRTSFNSLPQPQSQERKQGSACSVCGGRSGKMLVAMDRKFHVECFRCMSCNEVIDPSSVFAVSVDPMGEQQPLHRKCYAEFYGVQCAVCKKAIPANEDGSVSFIKHPFFNTEQMCPCHADEVGRRRCTGCHRFEPEDEPFADLNDGDRCVCYACCRTVIMNNMDVKPLWSEVLRFFEFNLGLPIWEEMREIPILVVGQAALNENQLKDGTSVHGDSSQIMTRGLCLSEHDGSMSFRVPSQRFNDSTASFEACNHSGFMDMDVAPLKGNISSEVMAILCLSGLPRDLTASVLAHEATHAWIKLHPDFKVRKSLPAQVEEGCAQLVAYLFLCDGLEEPRRHSGAGPSDEKLRQYFKFSIETDDNDIYGEGYRRAALAYSSIGIAALLNHVVHYQEFPQC